MDLIEIETEFVEFLVGRLETSKDEVYSNYIKTKNKFNFSGNGYKKHLAGFHDLHGVLYNDATDRNIVESMRFFELMHTFRFISYRFVESTVEEFENKAKRILEFIDDPIILDYGCGLGHISYEICKMNSNTKVFLLDIDCLSLDFAEYRFKQKNFNVEKIGVTENNIYPALPSHNICIAAEVMEHLKNPTRALSDINKSMIPSGVLYGTFSNHKSGLFHPSFDLSLFRKELCKNFKEIEKKLYRRNSA